MVAENGSVLYKYDVCQTNAKYLPESVKCNVKLAWKNISVWDRRKKQNFFRFRSKPEHVQILHNVSGVVGSGTLLAIMGPSGAGKTTLLATISQRYHGDVTGEIQVNGRPVICKVMRSISGFVPQDEIIIGQLTVHEHLKFMARLKMDRSIRSSLRQDRLTSLINEFGLTKCVDQRLNSLSGGELKRVSLIVQLLTDPPIIYCDEPTSGLDSYNAEIIVNKLEQLASYGKVVICTIHQPTSGIFEKFHSVLLLADGRVAYNGPVDVAKDFFTNLGLRCPVGYNPAEFYVSQLAIYPEKEDASLAKIRRICDQFETSKNSAFIKRHFVNGCADKTAMSLEKTFVNDTQKTDYFIIYTEIKKVNSYVQFSWLLWRSMIDMKRDYKDILLRFILFLFIALLLSTPCAGMMNSVGQTDIQNLQGLMYLIITETVFTFCYSVFHTFSHEIPRLLREISNGLYRPFPFYLAKVLILVPLVVLQTFCYAYVIFYVVEMKGGAGGFLWFYIPVMICAISANAYGFFLSATFESIQTASLLSVPIDFIAMNYSGIYINLTEIPHYIAWIPYTSQFFLGTEAISTVLWGGVSSIVCDTTALGCLNSGTDVLKKYGFQESNYATNLLILCMVCVVCHFLGFLALRARSKKQPIY